MHAFPRSPGSRRFLASAFLLASALAGACRTTAGELPQDSSDRAEIEAVLDDWHAAASDADGERYFGHMSADAVFLGTDATERWPREEFRAYAQARFDAGRGWTYTTTERHVFLGAGGRSAWFDERLWNETYGDCRGTGALRRVGGEWKVAHYNLTFPVPNEIAREVVGMIQAATGVESSPDAR